MLTPDLQASFACEDVRVEAAGPHTVVGIINGIGTAMLPFQVFKLCVWTRWCGGEGNFRQLTRIVAPDEETMLVSATTEFHLPDEDSHTTNVNIFGGVQFSEEGVHHIEIYLDGELSLRYPLRVLKRAPSDQQQQQR